MICQRIPLFLLISDPVRQSLSGSTRIAGRLPRSLPGTGGIRPDNNRYALGLNVMHSVKGDLVSK
jgi:hypothetical protein